MRLATVEGIAVPEGRLWVPEGSDLSDPREALGGLLKGIGARLRGLGFLLAGFSDFMELEILNSVFGDHASINLFTAPTYLALTTVAVGETDTGSTITEASYTGYARKAIAAADMDAAASGSKDNGNLLQFDACTGGSSTVIGWAQCSASTLGNVGVFGTCTSTDISTTQTPAQVAAGGLVANLD